MTLKVILIGDSGVGKSSLVMRYIGEKSLSLIPSTTSPVFFSREINIGADRVMAEIWDTAGQEQYRSMMSIYYRGAGVAMLCFSHQNLEALNEWVDAVRNITPKCKIVPILTKGDLLTTQQIDEILEQIERLTEELGLQSPVVTSTVTGEGVEEAFVEAARCGIRENMSYVRPALQPVHRKCC
jgi:small GTP-binding protein